jgi:hypothetical protein
MATIHEFDSKKVSHETWLTNLKLRADSYRRIEDDR